MSTTVNSSQAASIAARAAAERQRQIAAEKAHKEAVAKARKSDARAQAHADKKNNPHAAPKVITPDNIGDYLRSLFGGNAGPPPAKPVNPDELIKKYGGREHLDTDGLGKELADMARTDPAAAWKAAQQIFGGPLDQHDKGKLREKDKDEVAQAMVDNLSDADLAFLATDKSGRDLLERAQRHLLSGSVHDDERATSDRVAKELTNYRTFFDKYQGVNDGSDMQKAHDPNASPEEAASAIKARNGGITSENGLDVNDFTY